ncbi:MAG: hypothetical protein LC768_12940 [Acidobacteria bacterium]|nr:hypothetical protein [Acidobacteriota bacterium]MCA1639217.1 hypothetical protein [Acidobacteriota bacterium]
MPMVYISQHSALFLGDLYGLTFDNTSRSPLQNNALSEFLYSNGFSNDWRLKFLKYDKFPEIKEAILSIRSEELIRSIRGLPKIRDVSQSSIESTLRSLSEIILNKDSGSKTLYFPEIRNALILSLREDGFFYYKSQLLTKEELLEKHQTFYHKDTDSFKNIKDMDIPTVESILTKEPLYKEFKLDDESFSYLVNQLQTFSETVDLFCVDCVLISTFAISQKNVF